MAKSGLEGWPSGQRLGLLGGTFDPIHHGHLAVAATVQVQCSLDGVVFLPAALPPHKQSQTLTPFADRFAMVAAAIAGHPCFAVSALEGERRGPSYSVDTLLRVREVVAPAVRLFFVVGMDAFVEIGSWKNYRQLLTLADLVVIDRPGQVASRLAETMVRCFPGYAVEPADRSWRGPAAAGIIHPLTMEPVAVSSTEIRRRVGAGGPIEGLVPGAVAEYIRKHGLYRQFRG